MDAEQCLWDSQSLCAGIVLRGVDQKVLERILREGKVSCYGIATFEDLEVFLQELNDETANRRWKELKELVPLSGDFIKFVKTNTTAFHTFHGNVPLSEEDRTKLVQVYKTLLKYQTLSFRDHK